MIIRYQPNVFFFAASRREGDKAARETQTGYGIIKQFCKLKKTNSLFWSHNRQCDSRRTIQTKFWNYVHTIWKKKTKIQFERIDQKIDAIKLAYPLALLFSGGQIQRDGENISGKTGRIQNEGKWQCWSNSRIEVPKPRAGNCQRKKQNWERKEGRGSILCLFCLFCFLEGTFCVLHAIWTSNCFEFQRGWKTLPLSMNMSCEESI